MTKEELVKAARDIPVRMGDAEKLRAQQRQAVGPAPGALETWCPPTVPAPKKRVKALPPARAGCGTLMDADRLAAHEQQCTQCQVIAVRDAYERGLIDREDAVRRVKEIEARRACSGCGAGEAQLHPQNCPRRAVAQDLCKTCGATKERHFAAPMLDHDFDQPRAVTPKAPDAPPPITCCRIGAEMALDWPGIGRRACPFHAGKKPAPTASPPWVPEVDDWDLLPNA